MAAHILLSLPSDAVATPIFQHPLLRDLAYMFHVGLLLVLEQTAVVPNQPCRLRLT